LEPFQTDHAGINDLKKTTAKLYPNSDWVQVYINWGYIPKKTIVTQIFQYPKTCPMTVQVEKNP